MRVAELSTPALVVDLATLDHNIDSMAAVRPGQSLRAHVKAHKSTALAAYAAGRSGSNSFCAATLREVDGLIRAGLGHDVLLANETLDIGALERSVNLARESNARLTIAIDSPETLGVARVAAGNGPLEVLIDVNVGMPRCGIAPGETGALAESARQAGLSVRGVMGYEGHVVGNTDRAFRVEQVAASMELLRAAHEAVGGGIASAGGTGTFDLHHWADEVQAGSFLLMDTSYSALDLPFRQSATVLATVISVNRSDGYAVGDAGLKAFGMDHGEPTIIGHTMFFTSDEHVTFVPGVGHNVSVGDRIHMVPSHIDPTMAMHERVHVIESRNTDGTVPLDAEVIDTWPVDLRNW
ncbi:MAG: alanine racemase [Microthrixaceae bacterium]|nr:alanine racemase [Microthrixaceae bacterium]